MISLFGESVLVSINYCKWW